MIITLYYWDKKKTISTSHEEMGDVKTTKDLKYQMFLHSVRLSVVNIPNG